MSGLNGTERWHSALQSAPADIVLSDLGLLVTRNQARNLWVHDLQSGELRWALADAADITAMAVDDANDLLYLCYFNERLEALNVADGSLAWQYDYSYLLEDKERQELVAAANAKLGLSERNGYDRATLDNVSTVIRPDGIILAFDYGFMLCLDNTGKLRWQREDLDPISSVMGFVNGIITQHYWYAAEIAPQGLYVRASALPLVRRPAWPAITASWDRISEMTAEQLALRQMDVDEQREFQRQQRLAGPDEPLRVMYTNLAVLDPLDGSQLDSMPIEGWVRTGMCPARDKVVFEDSSYQFCWYANNWQGGNRRVSAYNWLVPGGES